MKTSKYVGREKVAGKMAYVQVTVYVWPGNTDEDFLTHVTLELYLVFWDNGSFMKLSIIIPVFNEATTVQEILLKAGSVFIDGFEKEIIVVDDGSRDNSRIEIQKAKALLGDASVILICHENNLGKGAAIRSGLKTVSGDYVLIQDADLEYFPEDYHLLLEPLLKKETEVVFGSRFLRKNERNYFYAFGNILATWIFNFFFGTKISDLATCYKIFPIRLKEKLLKSVDDDFIFDVVFLTYVITSVGIKIKEVPIRYEPRALKLKKFKLWHGVKIFYAIFKLGFQNVIKKIF